VWNHLRLAVKNEGILLFQSYRRASGLGACPLQRRLLREKVRTLELDDAQNQEPHHYLGTLYVKLGTAFARIQHKKEEIKRVFLGGSRRRSDLDAVLRHGTGARRRTFRSRRNTGPVLLNFAGKPAIYSRWLVPTTDAQLLVFVDEELAGTLAELRWADRRKVHLPSESLFSWEKLRLMGNIAQWTS